MCQLHQLDYRIYSPHITRLMYKLTPFPAAQNLTKISEPHIMRGHKVEWMNESDLSDAVTETVAGALYIN